MNGAPNSPLNRKLSQPAAFRTWIILAALVSLLVLTGLAWKQPISQTLAPTKPPAAIQPSSTLTLTPTAATASATAPDVTTGIVLAGAFLVLIILGGTLGASRRKS